jgi:hypothetical protein
MFGYVICDALLFFMDSVLFIYLFWLDAEASTRMLSSQVIILSPWRSMLPSFLLFQLSLLGGWSPLNLQEHWNALISVDLCCGLPSYNRSLPRREVYHWLMHMMKKMLGVIQDMSILAFQKLVPAEATEANKKSPADH